MNAINEALIDGSQFHRIKDGATVKAVNVKLARDKHKARFVESGTGKRPGEAERKSWERNLEKAQEQGLIAGEKNGDVQLIWLARSR
jgi:hypothetical protein